MNDSIKFCLDMVRMQDRARYLTTLHAPSVNRSALWALHAFNLELARIRDSVSEPMIGEIRISWWREAVDGIYANAPRQHPVVEAMLTLVPDVPQALLGDMIEGRLTDIYDGEIQDFAGLESYAAQTGGAQQQAVMHVLGCTGELALETARQVGTSWSLLGIVRAIAFHARLQRVYLPEQALRALGIDREALYQRPIGPEIVPVVHRIAQRADDLLASARQSRDRQALPGLLIASLAQDYLKRLQTAGFDVTKADLDAGDVTRQLKMLGAVLRGGC
jgi:NADH dehydrogenase [ubiquinone] 1 alpha subcomplex assembly factor 6